MCSNFEYGLNAAAKEFDGTNKYIRITDIDDDSRAFSTADITSPDICLDGMTRYLLSNGDIVFARTGASVGKTYIYKENDGIVYFAGFLIRAKVTQENDAEFVFQNTLTSNYEKYIRITSQRSGQPGVNAQEYGEYEFLAPSKEEQAKIGKYLRELDDLITLHQRKYAKLVNIKKSMLEKMFPKDGEVVPEIRFAGFTDAWEQRKVYELIEDYIERTTVQNQYPVLTSSQQYGIVRQEDYFADRQVTTSDNIGYYVLPFGYFTYRSRSDTDLFVFNRNTLINKGIISYYYPVFKAKNCDSNFLLRRLNHGIRQQLAMAAEGTGQKVLAHSKFKNMVIDVPSQREQERIGLVFEQIDSLITLHQRKYAKLVNIKKSMLEKMFPKDGEVVPEIRFAGFTDAWEQRKVYELIEDYIERTTVQNQYPVLTSSQQYGIVRQEDYFADRQVTTSDNIGYYVLPFGYFTYRSRSDTDLFVFNRNTLINKGIISYYYPVFKAKNCDSNFLLRRLNHGIRQQLAMAAEGTGQKVLAHSKFKNMVIDVPSQREQERIGLVFEQIDSLITLHQRKLERLQNIKKSCLEKMFV